MNEDLKIRQQYIRSNNELNRGPDTKSLAQASRNKVELDRKLEELSIQSGVSLSGNLVRQNVLNSSVSHATTLNNTANYEASEEEENVSQERLFKDGINRGKNNIQKMRELSQTSNELDKFKYNKFNRNI